MVKLVNVNAADEEGYYLYELPEEVQERILQYEYFEDMAYDEADILVQEDIECLDDFLNQIYCSAINSDLDLDWVELELDRWGEDLFDSEALDANTGHMDDLPVYKSNGLWLGEIAQDKWNRERAILQKQVDALNERIDEYLEVNEDNEEATEELWSYEGPFQKDLDDLAYEYLDKATEVTKDLVDLIEDERESVANDIVGLIDRLDIKFDLEGNEV